MPLLQQHLKIILAAVLFSLIMVILMALHKIYQFQQEILMVFHLHIHI